MAGGARQLIGPARRGLTSPSPGDDLLGIEPTLSTSSAEPLSAVLGTFGLVERRGFNHRGELVPCRPALGIGAIIREQAPATSRRAGS